jgi:hypothetical protein
MSRCDGATHWWSFWDPTTVRDLPPHPQRVTKTRWGSFHFLPHLPPPTSCNQLVGGRFSIPPLFATNHDPMPRDHGNASPLIPVKSRTVQSCSKRLISGRDANGSPRQQSGTGTDRNLSKTVDNCRNHHSVCPLLLQSVPNFSTEFHQNK